MDELKVLKEAFDTGTPPAGADMKKFQKLLKKYGHLVHPRFVRLYPVRDCRYEGDIYRVFAFSVSGETVDSDILGVIKEEVATLPVGSIRYNAAEAGSRDLRLEDITGRFLEDDEFTDDLMSISNKYMGVVLITMTASKSNVGRLDCDYAALGKWDGSGFGKFTGYTLIPIENSLIGGKSQASDLSHLPDAALTAEADHPQGAMEKAGNKYMQLMQYIFYVLLALGLIWYFFIR